MENKNHFKFQSVETRNKSDWKKMGLSPLLHSIILFYRIFVNFRYMEEKFDQNEYIKEYNKKHYSQFKIQLKKSEMEDLNQLLKNHNMSKCQFVRWAKDLLILLDEEKEIQKGEVLEFINELIEKQHYF